MSRDNKNKIFITVVNKNPKKTTLLPAILVEKYMIKKTSIITLLSDNILPGTRFKMKKMIFKINDKIIVPKFSVSKITIEVY